MNILPKSLRKRIADRPNLLKIADNVGWLVLDKVVRMGVGLFVAVWIARYLGPAQYGMISFGWALVAVFGAITGLGLRNVVVRDIVRDPSSANVTLGVAAVLQLIAGIIAYILLLIAVAYLRHDDPVARGVVALLGSMLLLESSKIAGFWFESQVQSKYVVWVENGALLAFAAVKVALILVEAPLAAFVWAALAEAITVACFLLLVMNKKGPSIGSLHVRVKHMKLLLGDSWPLLISGLLVALNTRADVIMIGQMIGDTAAGIYAAAARLSEVWYVIIPIVVNSIFPSIALLHARRSSKMPIIWSRAYTLMTWMSISAAATLTLFADQLVYLTYGNSYLDAAPIIAIHAWAGVNVALGTIWAKYMLLKNAQRVVLYGQSAGVVVNIGLNLYLIPKFALVGAAVATLIGGTVSSIINFSMYHPRETFGYLWAAVNIKYLKDFRLFSFVKKD